MYVYILFQLTIFCYYICFNLYVSFLILFQLIIFWFFFNLYASFVILTVNYFCTATLEIPWDEVKIVTEEKKAVVAPQPTPSTSAVADIVDDDDDDASMGLMVPVGDDATNNEHYDSGNGVQFNLETSNNTGICSDIFLALVFYLIPYLP